MTRSPIVDRHFQDLPRNRILALAMLLIALLGANLINLHFQRRAELQFENLRYQVGQDMDDLQDEHRTRVLALHMASYAGALPWENRSFEARKRYEVTYGRLVRVFPGLARLIGQENEAGLNAFEDHVFESVRLGDLRKARREIRSLEAERVIESRSKELEKIDQYLDTRLAEEKRKLERLNQFLLQLVVLFVCCALLFFIHRTFRIWAGMSAEIHLALVRKVDERTRELLEERAKLEHASKMATLGEMAGGIAHEINTPLASISLLAEEVLEHVTEGGSGAEGRRLAAEAAARIQAVTGKIALIVKGLRTFARDGSRDPFVRVALGQLLEEVSLLSSSKIKGRSARLDLMAIRPGLEVEGMEIQLSQVLLNLIQNALDAVESLEERWIRLEVRERVDEVDLLVIDSGRGIPEEVRAKLFNPFFTTKGVGKGTGLGLSLSLGIVKSHHGSLFVEENTLHTTFVVRLPKRQPSGQLRQPEGSTLQKSAF